MNEKYDVLYYDYTLPEHLIAQYPAEERDSSRMMVLERETGDVHHRSFRDLPSLLPHNTLAVFNNTKVIHARLRITRSGGGKGEFLLLYPEKGSVWRALARPARKIRAGDLFMCGKNLKITVEKDRPQGEKSLRLETPLGSLEQAVEIEGEPPLPPYIKRESTDRRDRERYQTVYARKPGSSAAPTAGLHFTPDIISRMKERGIDIAEITLHVGTATFLPVRSEDIRDHSMHTEQYIIPAEAARALSAQGTSVLSVGTTSMRALETAAQADSLPETGGLRGETDLFIYPGFTFRAVDMLLTNFHLPRSTLLMLVCAFAGHKAVMNAYQEAIREQYRFYSYGDCMLIM